MFKLSYYAVSASLFFLLGCNSEKVNENNAKEKAVNEEPSVVIHTKNPTNTTLDDKAIDIVKKNENFISNIKHLKKSQSVSVNNQKLQVIDLPLKKGSKIYNPLMQENGTVKGDIVIVSIDSQEIESELVLSSISQIAKDTYRVIPKIEGDLFTVYQKALSLPSVTQVELSIDYSGSVHKTESK